MDQFRGREVETLTSTEAIVSVASGFSTDMDGVEDSPAVMLEVRNRKTGNFEQVSLAQADAMAVIRALVRATTAGVV